MQQIKKSWKLYTIEDKSDAEPTTERTLPLIKADAKADFDSPVIATILNIEGEETHTQ